MAFVRISRQSAMLSRTARHGIINKTFSVTHLVHMDQAHHRYSPAAVIAVAREAVRGEPEQISTSYVERSNLSIRMASRRFTRLTNGFSKKLDNHCSPISLYVAHYNLCRVHESLRTTPAVQLGITDRVVAWRSNRRRFGCCYARPDRNRPGSPAQVPSNRGRPSIKTKPGDCAGLRHTTRRDGRAAASHHGNAVTDTDRPCLYAKDRRGPIVRAKSGSVNRRALGDQNAIGHTRSQRLTSIRGHGSYPWSPPLAVRSNNRKSLGTQRPRWSAKGIASDGEFYRSVLSERTKCPKCLGVRTAPPQVLAPLGPKGTSGRW